MYVISFQYLLAYFDQLFYTIAKVFYTNFEIVCIFSKISKAFGLTICLQILKLKSCTMLKLI